MDRVRAPRVESRCGSNRAQRVRPRPMTVFWRLAIATHEARGRMDGRIQAWQCIGCGRVEAPQNCIGVCQDRRIELVDARRFDELQRALDAERVESGRLLALVQQLAWSKPRPDAWERSYKALQEQARALVEEIRKATQSAEAQARVGRLDA